MLIKGLNPEVYLFKTSVHIKTLTDEKTDPETGWDPQKATQQMNGKGQHHQAFPDSICFQRTPGVLGVRYRKEG